MVRYKGYGRIHIAVTDVERSKAFYNALGMEVRETRADGGLMMALGNNVYDLDISKYEPEAMSSSRLLNQRVIRIALEVETEDDLRSAWLAMKEADIRPLGAIDHGGRRSVYFEDPDGSIIEIYLELSDAREIYHRHIVEGAPHIEFLNPEQFFSDER